jgi:DNA-binding CsgD family transcriptional regulator
VYELAMSRSTREISQILGIPEKQVRQVYSAIRVKSKEFANKFVSSAVGAEYAQNSECPTGRIVYRHNDFVREPAADNSRSNLTAGEICVLQHIKKGISIKETSKLTGKSIQAVRKTYQRAKKKLSCKSDYFDDNFITKLDVGKTYVKINFNLISEAMNRANLTADGVIKETGISAERVAEIEKRGTATYDELFRLIRCLNFNPYGPSEKDELLKKLSDTQWIRMVRAGKTTGRKIAVGGLPGWKTNKEKTRYRNRVMYYGTAYYRYNSYDRDKPVIEDGRNGLFPIELTRKQQLECGWLLKKFMLKPVCTYRYPGLKEEIARLESMLNEETDEHKADRYKREILHLREDILAEDGSSIFIINRSQMSEINRVLFGG